MLLFRNGYVNGQLVDIQIMDGVIAAIGPGSAQGIHGANTDGPGIDGQVIDLEGRFVSPGLWDNHVHFSQWALGSQRLDVSTARSAAEVAALVGAVVGARDGLAVETVVATGFRDGLWPDVPTIDVLDAATGRTPVVLVSGDLHAVWLNSAALELHGHAGHPTGLLREGPAFTITRAVGEVPDEQLDAWAVSAGATAARRGVVGFIDLEMTWNLDTWQRRMTDGFDTQRVEFGIYTHDLDRAIALGLRTGQRREQLLTVGRFKVIIDGSLNTRTGFCVDDYPGTHSHGSLEVPPALLLPLMAKAVAAGIEPSVHAIGDAALTHALDAFEQIGCRGTIEHAQLVQPADVARFGRLGVTASVQPEHAMDDRDVADHYWSGRTDRVMPLRSLLDAGATLAFGSDAPVAPLDPWVAMAAAVGRARDGREPWHPEQRITNAEAIAASVRTSVEVGQPADLVLTDIDPLIATHEQLRAMPVAATLLAGRFTHTTLG